MKHLSENMNETGPSNAFKTNFAQMYQILYLFGYAFGNISVNIGSSS